MAKYRKRPVIIGAEQWFPGQAVEGVRVLDLGLFPECPDLVAVIDTLEGQMRVRPGSWIITGVRGEKYACADGIFQETYEAVEDGV